MSTGLLEKESTGGAIARDGFEYQDAFVLQHLPLWMSQSAFSHVVSEAIGDVEVCYFAPRGAVRRVMYEAKNNTLSATAFWDEITRFKTVKDTSPEEYVRFVLVCRGYNTVTAPLLAKIDRLRGVGSSFQGNSTFLSNGRQEVIDWVVNGGNRADLAEFALDHIDFVTFASEQADSAFSGELERHLPSLDLSGKQIAPLRDRCKAHIALSSLGPIYRKDIEANIIETLAESSGRWTSIPSRLHLRRDVISYDSLGLAVGKFDGPAREAATAAEWVELSTAVAEISEFIKSSTARRCIVFDGKQRMSTACLIGYAFGATRGFTLQIEHNGLEYRTDIHSRLEGTFFSEARTPGEIADKEGVARIGFPTPIGADYSHVASGHISRMPALMLDSSRVIDGIAALNLATSEAKAALVRFRSEFGLNKVHLFIKAPSVFAAVLGHRLNGVCAVQLYDWVDGGYVATVLLSE